jgi:hypothetical protein
MFFGYYESYEKLARISPFNCLKIEAETWQLNSDHSVDEDLSPFVDDALEHQLRNSKNYIV